MQLSAPLQFQFTDPDDVAAYGDQWQTWDEQEIAGLRGRELIQLEESVDMPIVDVISGLRTGSVLPQMAAMWIVLHRAGQSVEWDAFNPLVLAVAWRNAPLGEAGSGGDPAQGSGSSSEPAPESATS